SLNSFRSASDRKGFHSVPAWPLPCMKKALAILATVATLGATVMYAPAEARGWRGGWGPGLAVRPWLRARSPPEPSQLARSRTIMGRATGITTTPSLLLRTRDVRYYGGPYYRHRH